jgi:predicted unusual protein kinase regulating ubiquinone biosynthesis (AarF/ABC1/UbiB family)
MKAPDAVPVGKLSRTAVLGVTAAKIGTRKLRLLSERPFLSAELFGEYSSGRVLTTEFLDGVHLDQWMATRPSRARRDRVAQLIYDFFVYSLFEFHRMHADPNPGNYLLRSDETVAVVDFGSVKVFTPDVCALLLKIWRASIHGDLDAIIDGYCAFGLADGDRKLVGEVCATRLAPFGEWMSAPFQLRAKRLNFS